MEQGIILIDKPKGISSFDVIRQLRKKLGAKKMGHAGTLDPLASGLMIIGVGGATKKMFEYVGLSKVYETEVLLGRKTTTGDMEGDVVEAKKVLEIDNIEVKRVLKSMLGKVALFVPVYSAVKQGGVPLYKKARSGEDVAPPIKEMEIKSMELLGSFKDGDCYVLKIVMEVGSGAYVRSIAEEIGRRLGVPATVKELRRTRIGNFDIVDSEKL